MALSMSAELCKHSAILPTRQSIQSNTRPTSLPLSNFLGRLHFQQTGPLSNPTRPIQQHFTLVRASAAGNGNSIGRFFKKVLNSTPIIGLLSNLTVDAGTPFVYYSQFGRQVADRASQETDEAFSDFEAIHGKPARFGHVLFCCWIASSGAGLLRRDDVLVAAKRLRYSLDLQFEVENQERLMQEAILKLEKLKKPIPEFPLLAKIDVAVQTLCKCCIGQDVILEEDRMLLRPILKACFAEATSSMIEDALSPYLEKNEVVGPGVSDAVTG